MVTVKKGLRRLVGEESGAVLIMALVAVLVGAVLLTPLLGLMGTGLMGGQIYEEKMHELYAADAGVEDALWKMIHEWDVFELSKCQEIGWQEQTQFELDGRMVRAEAQFVGTDPQDQNKGIFKITSQAFALDDSDFSFPLTTIVSYVTANWIDDNDENGNGENGNGENGNGEYQVYVPGSGSIDGGNWIVEDGGTVDGNIEGTAVVYGEGDLTVEGNIEDGAQVYVEGDLTLTGASIRSGNIEDEVIICVGGDLTINGNIEDDAMVYIKGNLTLTSVGWERQKGKILDEAQVCVEGDITANKIEDDPIVCAGGMIAAGIDGGSIYADGFPNPFADCPMCCVGDCEICCDCPIQPPGGGGDNGEENGGNGDPVGGDWDPDSWTVTNYIINPDSD